MTFYPAVEMHELCLASTTYGDLLVLVLNAILTAMGSQLFTVTQDVSSASAANASRVKTELSQLGYTIDDDTTPGSWIITW